MATRNTRIIHASPDDVFTILANGWLVPSWVVGATRMRSVDPDWPEQGSQIHHSLGVWPVTIDDETEVIEWTPPTRLRLRVRASILGRGVVIIDVRPHPAGSLVRMTEQPVSGAGALIPKPLWAPILTWRNREAMRRLAFIAEGHARRSARSAAPEDLPPASTRAPSGQASADAREADEAHAAMLASGSDESAESEAIAEGASGPAYDPD